MVNTPSSSRAASPSKKTEVVPQTTGTSSGSHSGKSSFFDTRRPPRAHPAPLYMFAPATLRCTVCTRLGGRAF